MALALPRIEGTLHVKGSLSQKADNKKFETYFFVLEDCLLSFYNPVSEGKDPKSDKKKSKEAATPTVNESTVYELLDVFPLTYYVLEDLQDAGKKSDKPHTNFAFILTHSQNKKLRTVFCTDTEEELKNWKKQVEASILLTRAGYFETNVADACLKSNRYLPDIVTLCINHIDRHLKIEGLFRVPGDKTLISEAKDLADKGFLPDFTLGDIHLVCGILKNYLREMAEPLVPLPLYKQAIDAQSPPLAKALVDVLPLPNRTLLCFLLRFLNRVEKESQFNLMDVNNLATVFGPTIIRNQDDSGPNSLQNMAMSNQVIKIMLQNTLPGSQLPIFNNDDVDRVHQPIVNYDTEISRQKLSMNTEERKVIEQTIEPHHSEWIGGSGAISPIAAKRTGGNFIDTELWDPATTLSLLVNTFNAKSQTLEPHILVCDLNRLYVFARGGKLEFQFHMMDLKEIDSPSKSQLTLIWNEGGKSISLELHPISYASFDMDAIIDWLHSNWELNFVGVPESEKFSIRLGPPTRKDALMGRVILENKAFGCGGLVRTYISVSDWQNTLVQGDIIWDLENYFYPNNKTVFNFNDILHKEKYPNPEFLAMAHALRYNTWFKELNGGNCNLKDESTAILGEIFRRNTTLEVLSVANAGAERNGILELCEAFDANPANSLTSLDLTGNFFDARVTQSFSKSLCDSLGKLKKLNLSNCQIKKMPLILEAIGRTISLVNGLSTLNLSSNKMDAESSKMLGTVLFMSKALKSLSISGASPIWASIIEGTCNKPNTYVTSFDISHNPTKQRQLSEISGLCQLLPNLENLNISDTGISSETTAEILKSCPKLSVLDLSENEFADETIVDFLKQSLSPLTELKKLVWNKSFGKNKTRNVVMKALAKAITSAGIKEFYIRDCKLKQDSVELVSNFLNNNTLALLDISGNYGGEELAVALGKLFSQNRTLKTLYFDNNEPSLMGLRAIRLGLSRTPALEELPLPVMDIDALLKKPEADINGILEVAKDLQKIILEKVNKRVKAEVEKDRSNQPPQQILSPSALSSPPPSASAAAAAVAAAAAAAVATAAAAALAAGIPAMPSPDTLKREPSKRRKSKIIGKPEKEGKKGTPRTPHGHSNSDDSVKGEDEVSETSESDPQDDVSRSSSSKQKKKLNKKKREPRPPPPSYTEATAGEPSVGTPTSNEKLPKQASAKGSPNT